MTQNSSLDIFPFPELYKDFAIEESGSDSDSELVKVTKSKKKLTPKAPWFRKKSKDKPQKEQMDEKGNGDPPTLVTTTPALPSLDAGVAEGIETGIEEVDKGEGTSSVPQVRVYSTMFLWISHRLREDTQCYHAPGAGGYSWPGSTHGAS